LRVILAAVFLFLASWITVEDVAAAPDFPTFLEGRGLYDEDPSAIPPVVPVAPPPAPPPPTLALLSATYGLTPTLTLYKMYNPETGGYVVSDSFAMTQTLQPTVENIKAYIVLNFAPLGAEAVSWGLRVAYCESRYDPAAYNRRGNWQGLYQYHPQTWAKIGQGNIKDWQAQVRTTAAVYASGGKWHWACR
jgi:hypothetical protein